MAQYNGYVSLPHESYDAWRSATLGSGFDYDGYYHNQCWDYVQECYAQYGLTLYTGGQGGAADCWLVSRARNAQSPFIAVEGKENIKRGDVIVTDRYSGSSTGHICFADEDYNGTDSLRVVGQVPSLHGQNGAVSVDTWSLSHFLGIFRNSNWEEHPTPPTPSGENKKKKFPWAVALASWNY